MRKPTLTVGLEVTGLADSTVFDGPRVKAFDVTGTRTYQDLAAAFRKALDEIRRVRADVSRKLTRFALPELQLDDSSIDPGPLNSILDERGRLQSDYWTGCAS